MTYEHGKAPPDAPVTWQKSGDCILIDVHGANSAFTVWTDPVADSICRAFHLAKLAEEAAPCVQRAADDEDMEHAQPATNWLRRFRAAKGEA